MKKLFLIGLLAGICLVTPAQTQNRTIQTNNNTGGNNPIFDPRRLTFGGRIGLQFGSYDVVNIAPQVGYNFSRYLNAGVGFNYTYYNEDYHYSGYKWQETNHYLGFNVYARVFPVDYVVVMVQPEVNRMWSTVKNKHTGQKWDEEKFIPVFLVGAGLRLGPVTAMLQYDIAQNSHSPYGDNIFYSVGYTFGF